MHRNVPDGPQLYLAKQSGEWRDFLCPQRRHFGSDFLVIVISIAVTVANDALDRLFAVLAVQARVADFVVARAAAHRTDIVFNPPLGTDAAL